MPVQEHIPQKTTESFPQNPINACAIHALSFFFPSFIYEVTCCETRSYSVAQAGLEFVAYSRPALGLGQSSCLSLFRVITIVDYHPWLSLVLIYCASFERLHSGTSHPIKTAKAACQPSVVRWKTSFLVQELLVPNLPLKGLGKAGTKRGNILVPSKAPAGNPLACFLNH